MDKKTKNKKKQKQTKKNMKTLSDKSWQKLEVSDAFWHKQGHKQPRIFPPQRPIKMYFLSAGKNH